MAGKDKGEQGKVVAVMRKKQEVLVEGLNCVCCASINCNPFTPRYVRIIKSPTSGATFHVK